MNINNFQWGDHLNDPNFEKMTKDEIFDRRVYERVFKVNKNDIVVDIGASVGPFVCSILKSLPQHVYAVEPSAVFFKQLVINTRGFPVSPIKMALSDVPINSDDNSVYYNGGSSIDVISFDRLVDLYGLDKIDFLKIDCEGGEYSMFTEKNMDYILKNVGSISGEWHLNTPQRKEQFRFFRDNFIKRFKKYEVFSFDGVDIKWDLFNEHFISYYKEVMIYLSNK